MSMGATLSIMGLYNNDNTVLDLMEFPQGFSEADKQTVKESILTECAEFEVLYPAPAVMKTMIGIWSRKEMPYWQRVFNASLLEYDPIENYHRTETETIEDGKTETHSGSDQRQTSKSGTQTADIDGTVANSGTDQARKTGTEAQAAGGTDTASGTSSGDEAKGGSDVSTEQVNGYDGGPWVDRNKTTTQYGQTSDTSAEFSNTQTSGRTDTTTFNTTDATTYGKTETSSEDSTITNSESGSDTLTHGERIAHEGESSRRMEAYGNIGTMTSQDMLTQELEVAKIINVMAIIIDSFKDRFCLMIY